MSKVGPDGWEPVTLADCLDDLRNGWTYDTRALGGTLPITRIETISNGEINYDRVGRAQADKRMEVFRLRKNDILFSHINSVEHIAKVAMKRDDAVLYHGMNLMRLRPNQKVDPEFFYARLQSDETRNHFRASCKRAVNQASLAKGDIGSYVFSLPPLGEQRRIAEVLRSVDEAVDRERKVMNSASTSLEHALTEILPSRDSSDEGATITTVGEFAKVSTGKTPSTKEADFWNGDIPFVTPTDMDGSVRSVHAARSVTQKALIHTKIAPANSVLFTCIASIGKLWLSQEPVAFNQQINACTCQNAIDAEFLYWTLRRLTPTIKALSGITAVPIVNKTAFSRVAFAIPPAGRRREIVRLLSSISEVVEASNKNLRSLAELKRRLSHDLLSGRTRVPV